MEEKEIKKPLILEMDEARTEVVQAINNAMQIHNLPCYFIEMILNDVYMQVKEGAKSELAMAKEQMKE